MDMRGKIFFSMAVVLCVMTIAFNITGLLTYSWVTDKSQSSIVTLDNEWGLLGSCLTYNNTLNANETVTDACGGYGDSFDDFPHAAWGAAAIFLAGSVFMAAITIVLFTVGIWFPCVATIGISAAIFGNLFNLLAVFLFPVGFGSVYQVSKIMPFNNSGTMENVCSGSNGPYDIGNCSFGYSFGLVIGASICFIGAFVFLMVAKKSFNGDNGERNGNGPHKGGRSYGGYA